MPLAKELHDKTLHTSATIDKGDWLAGLAGILGILGIAYGYWWADGLAGGLISLEIIKDGFTTLKNSVYQLMNMRPTGVESKKEDPIYVKVQQEINNFDWVRESEIRMREDGDLISGEAFIVPHDEGNLMNKLGKAGERIKSLDWRIHAFDMIPVRALGGRNK